MDRKPFGLYSLAIERLKHLEESPSGIIRFPTIFESICRQFSINKKQCWELLFIFRDMGFIKIVPYQGIKILKD